jgi:hypothetical protein
LAQVKDNLLTRCARAIETNEIFISTEGYDLSKSAMNQLFSPENLLQHPFSEEAFNAYMSLLNTTSYATGKVYFFDTLQSSMIMSNIYNHERIRELFIKRGVDLEALEAIVFPIVDIAGSIQLIVAHLKKYCVTLFRDQEISEMPSKSGYILGNKPGVQFTALFNTLVVPPPPENVYEAPIDWALNDTQETGLAYSKGVEAIVSRVQQLVLGTEGIEKIDAASLLFGRVFYKQ